MAASTTAAAAPSSSARISLEVDNESALPRLLEGRTIAILGGPLDSHTSESREPHRRAALHSQLKQARRIRASLERAASRADELPEDDPASREKAVSILQSSLPEINRLVRLTEVLRGANQSSTTMDDVDLGGGGEGAEYDDWNGWTTRKEAEEEAQRRREQRIVRRQLREFAKERDPNVEIDEELERRHDELIPRPQEQEHEDGKEGGAEEDDDDDIPESDHGGNALHDTAIGFSRGAPGLNLHGNDDGNDGDFAPRPSPESFRDSEGDGGRTPRTDVTPSRSRRSRSKEDVAMDVISQLEGFEGDAGLPALSRSRSRKRPPEASVSEPPAGKARAGSPIPPKAPPEPAQSQPGETPPTRKAPPEALPPPEAKAAPKRHPKPKSAARHRPKAAGRPAKKCHECKASTTRYRSCNYWKLTGGQCHKKYCVDCLSSKYALGDDVMSEANPGGIPIDDIMASSALDAEWHCPCCLGTCNCRACVRQRRKEESRSGRAGRKSSRRAGAGGVSSFFF